MHASTKINVLFCLPFREHVHHRSNKRSTRRPAGDSCGHVVGGTGACTAILGASPDLVTNSLAKAACFCQARKQLLKRQPAACSNAAATCRCRYQGSARYNFSNPGFSSDTGSFTQVGAVHIRHGGMHSSCILHRSPTVYASAAMLVANWSMLRAITAGAIQC